jgi:hypothetical protein
MSQKNKHLPSPSVRNPQSARTLPRALQCIHPPQSGNGACARPSPIACKGWPRVYSLWNPCGGSIALDAFRVG